MNSYKQLYIKNLDSLSKEISSYKNEENIWKLTDGINNTPGNLCLHLCGNLNHFFGAVIGKTGYVRQRDMEFSKKNVSREELLKGIEETKKVMEKVLDNLKTDDLNSPYPNNTFGENQTIGTVIALLIFHLGYHLGQINYHRRLIDK
jgi:Protein of unknown function (DUF1572)